MYLKLGHTIYFLLKVLLIESLDISTQFKEFYDCFVIQTRKRAVFLKTVIRVPPKVLQLFIDRTLAVFVSHVKFSDK